MKYEIIRNDITNMDVDAIVLPSNSKLKARIRIPDDTELRLRPD